MRTAKWIGDCFIYTNASNRLSYLVGSESDTIANFDAPMYLLGYLPAHNRVYVADKSLHVFGYALSLALVEYQTAVLRGDMDAAEEMLPTIPKEQRSRVARFLEARGLFNSHSTQPERLAKTTFTGLKELALEVTTDPDHKFELSLQLDDLDSALDITRDLPPAEAASKWKALGDRALAVWRFDLAREAFDKAEDVSALFLLLLATGDREGLRALAQTAEKKGANNLAFASLFQLGEAGRCAELLVKTRREPEAALFARTYAPRCVFLCCLTSWRRTDE